MKVSLIITTFNEENNIQTLFDSIREQTEKPDEIIIVDSESKDKTVSIAEKELKKMKVKHKIIIKKCDRGTGRNIAIENSSFETIIGTDAGCILDKNWVKEMKKTLKHNNFAIGNFKATYENFTQECMSIVMYPSPNSNKKLTNASSRSIGFSKKIWRKAKGYPTNYGTGEDTEFNFRIKNSGAKIEESKNAFVYWKVRPTIKEFIKMFYSYGVGDRKNITRIPLNFGFAIGFLVYHLGILLSIIINPIFIFILISLLIVYCLKTGLKVMLQTKKIQGLFIGTYLFYLKRISYSLGLILGI